MKSIGPISTARAKLLHYPDSLNREVIEVTRKGEPVLAIMPWEAYESLIDTLELLSDSELMKELKESIKQADRGELISSDDVAKELGL